MSKQLRSRVVDLSTVPRHEKECFLDHLYRAHTKIFETTTREEFHDHIFRTNTAVARLLVLENTTGAVVGYTGFYARFVTVNGRAVAVVSIPMGIERAYRRQTQHGLFLAQEGLRFFASYPRANAYLFNAIVHPSSYLSMCRNLAQTYPHRLRESVSETEELFIGIADALTLRRKTDAKSALVRSVGGITRQTDSEKMYWRTHIDPDVRFFIENNPTYEQGEGLLVGCPLTAANLLRSIARFTNHRMSKLLESAFVAKR